MNHRFRCWCIVGLQKSTLSRLRYCSSVHFCLLVEECVIPHQQYIQRSHAIEIKDKGYNGTFCSLSFLSPAPLASTSCRLLMNSVTLAPASHRQLQPLRDYLCWAPITAGRSQQRKVTHWRGRSQPALCCLEGLVSILGEEDFEEIIISVWWMTEGENLDEYGQFSDESQRAVTILLVFSVPCKFSAVAHEKHYM